MLADFQIVTREEVLSFETEGCASIFGMSSVIRKAGQSLIAILSRYGQTPKGDFYIRYLNIDWAEESRNSPRWRFFLRIFTKKWSMKIGFPIQTPIPDCETFKTSRIPAGKYAQSLHKGNYYKVGSTYKAMLAEIRTRALVSKSESLEIYFNDPRTTKTEDLETLVLIPLAGE